MNTSLKRKDLESLLQQVKNSWAKCLEKSRSFAKISCSGASRFFSQRMSLVKNLFYSKGNILAVILRLFRGYGDFPLLKHSIKVSPTSQKLPPTQSAVTSPDMMLWSIRTPYSKNTGSNYKQLMSFGLEIIQSDFIAGF